MRKHAIIKYPEVREVIRLSLEGARSVLGCDFVVGLYLYGSLATGDFDPDRSDIDFVMVTSKDVPHNLVPGLESMHRRVVATGSHWASKLEGSYVSLDAIRRYDPGLPPCPITHDGNFRIARQGVDWVINRHIILQSRSVILGPLPECIIDPVSPDQLRLAVRQLLDEKWRGLVDRQDYFQRPVAQSFAVLTMCRALHTINTGETASKPVAAKWCRTTLDNRWVGLIDAALAWRKCDPAGDVSLTREFICYALKKAGCD